MYTRNFKTVSDEIRVCVPDVFYHRNKSFIITPLTHLLYSEMKGVGKSFCALQGSPEHSAKNRVGSRIVRIAPSIAESIPLFIQSKGWNINVWNRDCQDLCASCNGNVNRFKYAFRSLPVPHLPGPCAY